VLSTMASHVHSFDLPVDTPAPLLDIWLRRSAQTIEVDLVGDLDVSTVSDLWETLAAIALSEDEDLATVRVDLSRLNYVDSTGLGCLVTAHRRCTAAGIVFQLHQPDLFLQRLFEITGLDQLLNVE
jgi:anti-sigma B factor antagonist